MLYKVTRGKVLILEFAWRTSTRLIHFLSSTYTLKMVREYARAITPSDYIDWLIIYFEGKDGQALYSQ